jgi:hypothetical protein
MYEAPKSIEQALKEQTRYLRKIAGGHRFSALGHRELYVKMKYKKEWNQAEKAMYYSLLIAETLG